MIASLRATGGALFLPLMCWAVSLAAFLTILIAGDAAPVAAPAEGCRINEALTPPGFGTLKSNRKFSLKVDAETGRGLVILPGISQKLVSCHEYLEFGDLEIPAGYEVSLFRRDPAGGLQSAPIQSAWLTQTVYDLEALFDVPASSATEWGLSVQSIHQGVPGRDGSSHELAFSGLELAGPSSSTVIAALMTDWTAFRPWSGRSINVLSDTGGESFPWARPVFLLGLSLVPALLLALLILRRRPLPLVAGVTLPIVLSWFLVDASWHRNLTLQLRETSLLYDHRQAGAALADESDERLATIAGAVRAAMGETNRPVLVVAPDHFQRARLYYHLLPARAAMVSHGVERLHYRRSPSRLNGAYVVLLEGADPKYDPRRGLLTAGPAVSIPVEPVTGEEGWKLLRIRPGEGPEGER